MMKLLPKLFAVAALAFATQTFAADWAPGSTDWDKLPDVKKSKVGLYLTPQQAYDMKKANPKGVAFFDIRTRAEAMYVGWPSDADALVPYVEHPELMSDWDDKRAMYKLEPNQDFVPELERRLKEMGLGKDATIILVCRSGDRSSKAQDRLQTAGYTKVYGIAEGVEGDTAKEGPKAGQRVVNGWKNAGLPWTYKLDKAKMYFPR
ncbi:rhodanese-like domain-containing protein [Ferribacterium limneticum]|uniref:rhodanese-like domain-containing protein n=1 Tax=Ferribacterium limneticum TaxID=76259 RepID=UPI001CFAA717|nr:rhodanese-like domain-containing protein [Ferribacterium limneticum]UCV20386.1 sulfurtransferase [Ferribacterium limneticum]